MLQYLLEKHTKTKGQKFNKSSKYGYRYGYHKNDFEVLKFNLVRNVQPDISLLSFSFLLLLLTAHAPCENEGM